MSSDGQKDIKATSSRSARRIGAPIAQQKETELYISHLQARGIVAKATYWDRDGAEVLAFFKITNASPEIDAKIDRILKG
jgi:hypothetical protein